MSSSSSYCQLSSILTRVKLQLSTVKHSTLFYTARRNVTEGGKRCVEEQGAPPKVAVRSLTSITLLRIDLKVAPVPLLMKACARTTKDFHN